MLVTQCITCAPKITIMLDPAGDMHNPGRTIGNNTQTKECVFERTCTLYFARELKKALEKKDKNIMVLFTRLPGERANQIEKARLANQYKVDLFCHICATNGSNIAPQLHLYHYTPPSLLLRDDTWFVPIQQAHNQSHHKTATLMEQLYEELNHHSRMCNVATPKACPLSPLKGIISPAICIEFGIKQAEDLSHLVTPCADALYTCLKVIL
jgi:N-acetylmuramoyl-L-alanine amidase